MLSAQGIEDMWHNYTNGNSVRGLAVEGNAVWAATEGGVVRWNRADDTYVKCTTTDGLARNAVFAVTVDGAGHKWFGTDYGGVSEYDGSTWTTYTTADRLASDWVRAIAIDGTGHKWFGTYGDGVSRLDGSTWTTLTTADGLVDNEVRAFAVDGAGHMWVGTEAGLSEHITADEFVYLPLVARNTP
jgi:ligand-binding sensor domain-containing protein